MPVLSSVQNRRRRFLTLRRRDEWFLRRKRGVQPQHPPRANGDRRETDPPPDGAPTADS